AVRVVADAVTGRGDLPLRGLVLPRRDHRLDVMAFQPAPDAGIAVALVAGLPVRPGRPPRLTGPPGAAIDLLEPLRLVALAGRQHHGEEDAVAIADQMGLGAEAALRPPQRMI